VQIEERALHYIARKGDGSLRDAISLLDQCIAFHFQEALTYQKVLNVLGAASYELFSNLLTAILEGRTADCIYQIDEIVMQGRELGQLVSDFIWYLRNLMLLKSSDLDADILEVTEEEILDLGRMSANVSMDTLLRYIRIFSKLSGDIRNTTDKRVLLEMTLIKLTHPETEQNLDSILHRISNLEHRMDEEIARMEEELHQRPALALQTGGGEVDLPWESDEPVSDVKSTVNKLSVAKTVELEQEQYQNYQNILEIWDKIIENLSGHVEKLALRGTYLEPVLQADDAYVIVFTDVAKYNLGARDITMQHVETTASDMVGRPLQFRAKLNSDSEGGHTQYVSKSELTDVFQGIDIIEEE
jgi:DNA polymerase-3 subunit gamma/tau